MSDIEEKTPALGGKLVLGSASPRRREILQTLGIEHSVHSAEIDESPRVGEAPEAYVCRMAEEKLAEVARQLHGGSASIRGIVTADTVVTYEDKILGKPVSREDALRMLSGLVGRSHQVMTAYALSLGCSGRLDRTRTVSTEVVMRMASTEELERYVASGESDDKAGAYAVQGKGSFLVERIMGSYSAVVGLPACEIAQDLVELGLLRRFP